MEIETITKIGMCELSDLAGDGVADIDRNSYWEEHVVSVLTAIEKELQEHLDAAESVTVNGVELCNVEQVTLSKKWDDTLFWVTLAFRDADDRKLAEWSFSPDMCASLWVTSYGHGSIFITYGSKR